MKTIVIKPLILNKDISFLNIITIFLIITFILTNTYNFFDPTPPKVTSSYVCAPPATSLATISPVKTGLWNETSTWPNGNLPTANDDIIVPTGIDLIMVGVCKARNIIVRGKLSAVNYQPNGAWIELQARSITVDKGGLMEIGTETQPYNANKGPTGVNCQITLTGNKIPNAPSSHKGILVLGGGRLELHGKKRKSWTNLLTTANAGANKITLKEAVDWEAGDVIALTSTALATQNGKE